MKSNSAKRLHSKSPGNPACRGIFYDEGSPILL